MNPNEREIYGYEEEDKDYRMEEYVATYTPNIPKKYTRLRPMLQYEFLRPPAISFFNSFRWVADEEDNGDDVVLSLRMLSAFKLRSLRADGLTSPLEILAGRFRQIHIFGPLVLVSHATR